MAPEQPTANCLDFSALHTKASAKAHDTLTGLRLGSRAWNAASRDVDKRGGEEASFWLSAGTDKSAKAHHLVTCHNSGTFQITPKTVKLTLGGKLESLIHGTQSVKEALDKVLGTTRSSLSTYCCHAHDTVTASIQPIRHCMTTECEFSAAVCACGTDFSPSIPPIVALLHSLYPIHLLELVVHHAGSALFGPTLRAFDVHAKSLAEAAVLEYMNKQPGEAARRQKHASDQAKGTLEQGRAWLGCLAVAVIDPACTGTITSANVLPTESNARKDSHEIASFCKRCYSSDPGPVQMHFAHQTAARHQEWLCCACAKLEPEEELEVRHHTPPPLNHLLHLCLGKHS